MRSMIRAAEVEAEAASLTKAAVLAAAAAHRNLPPHHAEATAPEDAYRCADGTVTVSDALSVFGRGGEPGTPSLAAESSLSRHAAGTSDNIGW